MNSLSCHFEKIILKFLCIVIPFIIKQCDLIIYTNNTLSTISFKAVPKDVAQEYLEPIIKCLR